MAPALWAYPQMKSQGSRAGLSNTIATRHTWLLNSCKVNRLNCDVLLMEFFKSEPCALLNNLFLRYSQFFYFILVSLSILAKFILKTPVWCSCVFLRENKKRHPWLPQDKTGIRGPWGLCLAIRVTVEVNTAHGRGKTSGTAGQPLVRGLPFPSNGGLSAPALQGSALGGFYAHGPHSTTVICAPLWISRTEGRRCWELNCQGHRTARASMFTWTRT